jgi:ABC-type glycerol-3-phosphate transport system substrate-binding protein
MFTKMRTLLVLSVVALLTACGGGGGGGSTTPSTTATRTTSTPIAIAATSYQNLKEVGATQIQMPSGTEWNAATTLADFDRTGNLDMPKQVYSSSINE